MIPLGPPCTATTSISLVLARTYAATASRNGGKAKANPMKQVFNKKRKDSAATSPLGGIGVNRVAPLTQALFGVDPGTVAAAAAARSNPQEMHRRRLIEQAWRRFRSQRQLEQNIWEAGLLRSKCRALEELRKVSPRLHGAAVVYDYSLPPIQQRPATLTPPSPEQFPYKS